MDEHQGSQSSGHVRRLFWVFIVLLGLATGAFYRDRIPSLWRSLFEPTNHAAHRSVPRAPRPVEGASLPQPLPQNLTSPSSGRTRCSNARTLLETYYPLAWAHYHFNPRQSYILLDQLKTRILRDFQDCPVQTQQKILDLLEKDLEELRHHDTQARGQALMILMQCSRLWQRAQSIFLLYPPEVELPPVVHSGWRSRLGRLFLKMGGKVRLKRIVPSRASRMETPSPPDLALWALWQSQEDVFFEALHAIQAALHEVPWPRSLKDTWNTRLSFLLERPFPGVIDWANRPPEWESAFSMGTGV